MAFSAYITRIISDTIIMGNTKAAAAGIYSYLPKNMHILYYQKLVKKQLLQLEISATIIYNYSSFDLIGG